MAVLACAIVVVFCIGLIKLWYTNRLLKKYTILDLEKQERQQEMRRSGLPVGKRIDIPFGVRAIQSGIEVDGIWISRPGTPAESEGLAASTLVGSYTETKGKEKAVPVTGGLLAPTTAVIEVQPTPKQSPTPSLLDRNDAIYAPAPLRIPRVGPQSTYKPTQLSQDSRTASAESTSLDSIRQPEATGKPPPRLDTYIPSSTLAAEQNGAYRPMQRSSESFEDDEDDAQEYLVPTTRYQDRPLVPPPRRRSPFDGAAVNGDYTQRGGYLAGVEAGHERRSDPFESSEFDEVPSRNSQAVSHRANNSYESADSQMAPPQRSYSGETHLNVSSRRVNAGFEVLPAGTFGRSNSQTDMESSEYNRSRNRTSNVTKRLHKRGHER
ncbi:hypothetical protein SLS62_008082 [Diatrype stigma]|uniref:Uncharacterized protein n=1 Tax=Diatrype stigma TaxID=117547 RepID=A0AAN9YLT6_9PEZI